MEIVVISLILLAFLIPMIVGAIFLGLRNKTDWNNEMKGGSK